MLCVRDLLVRSLRLVFHGLVRHTSVAQRIAGIVLGKVAGEGEVLEYFDGTLGAVLGYFVDKPGEWVPDLNTLGPVSLGLVLGLVVLLLPFVVAAS